MYGAEQLVDDVVHRAAEGVREDAERVAEALLPQVRVMVGARLSPHPGHFDVIEEIAQTVMIALADGLPRLEKRTVASLKALASVIVSRRVVDFIRSRERNKLAGQPVASLDSTVAGWSDAGPLWKFLSISNDGPLTAAGNADQVSVVLLELGQLKEEYREVITLALFDQLSTAQVAERLGISRRAASMLLLRAVNALRRRVTGSSRPGTTHA